jgi:hypothetical protein
MDDFQSPFLRKDSIGSVLPTRFASSLPTHARLMILTMPARSNAHSPIRDNLDPDSNVTEESDLQPEKLSSPRFQPMAE